MRPIDADLLMEQVKAVHKAVNTADINQSYDTGFHSATSQMQGLIAYMPTLDYKDLVPQGEWLNINGGIHCSVCHMERDSYCHEKYCPECGAKMAEEERKCEIHPWWNE